MGQDSYQPWSRTIADLPDDHVLAWGEDRSEDLTAGDLRGLIEQLEAAQSEIQRLRDEGIRDITRREALNTENARLNTENRDLLEKWSKRGGERDALQEQLDAREAVAGYLWEAEQRVLRLRDALQQIADTPASVDDDGLIAAAIARVALNDSNPARESDD